MDELSRGIFNDKEKKVEKGKDEDER